MLHSLALPPTRTIGSTEPSLYITIKSGKAEPGPLNTTVGVISVWPIPKLLTFNEVLYSFTEPGFLGSPLKKLTGTMSDIGRSPEFFIRKKTEIPRFPQIGGITVTAVP